MTALKKLASRFTLNSDEIQLMKEIRIGQLVKAAQNGDLADVRRIVELDDMTLPVRE